jgi:DNA mismatch endonuclease, patch repair protein
MDELKRLARQIRTTPKRSRLMAKIRGRGNESTETTLARLFRAQGIKGWRRHVSLIGRPDFVFRNARLVVFVDGCFWHGCPKCYRAPNANSRFWALKVQRNRARDRRYKRLLAAKGWRVIRIWEHRITGRASGVVDLVRRALSKRGEGV